MKSLHPIIRGRTCIRTKVFIPQHNLTRLRKEEEEEDVTVLQNAILQRNVSCSVGLNNFLLDFGKETLQTQKFGSTVEPQKYVQKRQHQSQTGWLI